MKPLPGILAEIAEVAGEPAALALMAARGGTSVWIPAQEPPSWLITTVGHVAAGKIVDHFRILGSNDRATGMRITIPLGATSHERQARRRLAEALQAGMSPEQAARAAGVHERTAFRMQRRLRDRRNSAQLDLF